MCSNFCRIIFGHYTHIGYICSCLMSNCKCMNDDELFDSLIGNQAETQTMEDPSTTYNPEDDFEDFLNQNPDTQVRDEDDDNNDNQQAEPASTGFTGNVIMDTLRSRGFNPDAIKIEDEETGEEETKSWDELTPEEQYEVLSYTPQTGYELTNDEAADLNFLRNNGITLKEYADYVAQEAIREYQANPDMQTQIYTVDDFNDDELWIADFQNRYGDDLPTEELEAMLERAKENPTIFKRQVDAMRTEYKKIEDDNRAYEQQQRQQAEDAARNERINQVWGVASQIGTFHNDIEIDDNDRNELMSFMFTPTATGVSAFDKAIEDPAQRYKAAWYLKHGDHMIGEMQRYYKSEIAKLTRQLAAKTKPSSFIKR